MKRKEIKTTSLEVWMFAYKEICKFSCVSHLQNKEFKALQKRFDYWVDKQESSHLLSSGKGICKYSGKKGYVEEEDCHCFCCGTHDGISPTKTTEKSQ